MAVIEERWQARKEWEATRMELCPIVFWRPTKSGAKALVDFRKSWEDAVIAAGVPDTLFHDLRRNRARLWSQAGVPDRVSMALGGWLTRSVYDRYRIVSDGDMRDALKRAAQATEQATESKSA